MGKQLVGICGCNWRVLRWIHERQRKERRVDRECQQVLEENHPSTVWSLQHSEDLCWCQKQW